MSGYESCSNRDGHDTSFEGAQADFRELARNTLNIVSTHARQVQYKLFEDGWLPSTHPSETFIVECLNVMRYFQTPR